MVSELIHKLKRHASNPRFARLIAEAIDLVSHSTALQEEDYLTAGRGQSSQWLARILALRKRRGSYDSAILGLDETIDALSSTDTLVRLGLIQTDKGAVTMWLNEHDEPLGVMIFKKTFS